MGYLKYHAEISISFICSFYLANYYNHYTYILYLKVICAQSWHHIEAIWS